MKYEEYSHNQAEDIIKGNPKFKNVYQEIIDVIKSITDKMIIAEYNRVKSNRDGAKSPSQFLDAINQLIDKALINKSWNPQSPIFLDPMYKNYLDLKKNKK